MLKLVCKNAYVIFRIVTSGPDSHGIQVTEGREIRRKTTAKPPNTFWFPRENQAGLISRAASLIRTKLDKHYYRQEKQFDLFGNLEIEESLFQEKQNNDQEHPLLNKAYKLAQELPSTVKWKPVLLVGALPCNLCEAMQEPRTIVHIAIINSPTGAVLHLQCQECRTAETKPAEFKPITKVAEDHPNSGVA